MSNLASVLPAGTSKVTPVQRSVQLFLRDLTVAKRIVFSSNPAKPVLTNYLGQIEAQVGPSAIHTIYPLNVPSLGLGGRRGRADILRAASARFQGNEKTVGGAPNDSPNPLRRATRSCPLSPPGGSCACQDAWRPVLPGGGSVPGTPPSIMCSVHSDPDQYRCSCRPEGSVSQPGATPVNVTWPDVASTASDAWLGAAASVNELFGAEMLP